ncbi:MAG: ArsR family transcriptional regulator [Myxococcales bacterium]|nr:ArsR family transcriptional regulator [Myxococcales bacterium]
MKFSTLVERMVPLVAELFATLQVNDPLRMDFADIGQKTLIDIVGVLRQDGMTNEEIAQTLDLSIAGFYKRIRELRETYAPGKRGRPKPTLWEKVYQVVLQKTASSPRKAVRYTAVQSVFPSVPDERLRTTLRFLVRFGLLTVTGPTQFPEYRVVPRDEEPDITYHSVVVTLYREGPLSLADLAERLRCTTAECEPHLKRLRDAGKLVESAPEHPGGSVRYRATSYHIEPESDLGYQAALWDHFYAVVRAMCKKVRMNTHLAQLNDVIGGTTFSFDVPLQHPLYAEISGFLTQTRVQMEKWLAEVSALNQNGDPALPRARVTIYAGQFVESLVDGFPETSPRPDDLDGEG